MELITKLGIDWKILIAQIVNFTILLLVLRAFVYRPLLELLEKRRDMVTKSVEDAKNAEELLTDIEKTRLEAMEKIKVQSVKILDEASQKAEAMKAQITDAARKESDMMYSQAKLQMQQEKERMMKQLHQEIAEMVVTVSQKVLQREFSDTDMKRVLQEAAQEIAKNN
ncbi:MAG: F0F1 ATP synthase subunit B [Patescibacteria group bacterium]